jgi:signal transduction histidine kinase
VLTLVAWWPASDVKWLAPVLRRRWTEERLAQQAVRLARGNQALGDFAALVAHELKTPLELARLQDDLSVGVERALELVDVLLEAAQQAGERLPALQLVGDARPTSAAREPQRAARGP